MGTTDHPPILVPSRTSTPRQAPRHLGVSRWTIYRLVRRGDLRAVKVGERLRFRPTDADAYLERRGPTRKGQGSPPPRPRHQPHDSPRSSSGRPTVSVWTDADAAELDVARPTLAFDSGSTANAAKPVGPSRARASRRGSSTRPAVRICEGSRRSRSDGSARSGAGSSTSTTTASAACRARPATRHRRGDRLARASCASVACQVPAGRARIGRTVAV